MNPLGLLPLVQAWFPEHAALKIVIVLPGIVFLLLLWSLAATRDNHDVGAVSLPLSGISAIWPFFSARFDFLTQGLQFASQHGRRAFTFNLLRNRVVVVSGELARKDFFSCKGLDINEGFKVLSGALPMMPGVTTDLQARTISIIHRRLTTLQSSDRLSNLMPQILKDAEGVVRSWGNSGMIDPFTDIPAVVFQMTVRCLSCQEIADDAVLVERLRQLYDKLDRSTTPWSVLVPWLPSPSMITKVRASKEIYDIVCGAIKARAESGVSRDDALQMLLDHGDEKTTMIGFIMGLLVAGARSTGATASWMVTYLAGHPEWKNKAESELRELLSAHSDKALSKDATLAEQLASIPLEAWEKSTPVTDQIIWETLRLAEPHFAMRRNIGPEAYVDGVCIPTGTYVVYPFSDVHLNPALYPDPWRFDPGRLESKASLGYVGWGGGRTVCLGQRLARLELKGLLAMLLLKFDFVLADKSGADLHRLPQPNWNDTLGCKPPAESCYLRFHSTEN